MSAKMKNVHGMFFAVRGGPFLFLVVAEEGRKREDGDGGSSGSSDTGCVGIVSASGSSRVWCGEATAVPRRSR